MQLIEFTMYFMAYMGFIETHIRKFNSHLLNMIFVKRKDILQVLFVKQLARILQNLLN